MDLKKYQHKDWIIYYSGAKWSALGFSSWAKLYTRRPFNNQLDYFLKQNVIVWDGKTTTCYIRESEREVFGNKVVKKVINDPKYVDKICRGFMAGTDLILSVYDKSPASFTYQAYADYSFDLLNKYYPDHIQVKNVVDFLPKNLLSKYLPKLEAARVRAEPVFSREIVYMKKLAAYLGKKTGYKPANILFCFADELAAYWRDGKKLPPENILERRSRGCAVFFEKGRIQTVLTGKDLPKFSSIFIVDNKKTRLTGQTAFAGKAKGTVRLVSDPSAVKRFDRGDILVAPWTRPEYLPIMKKAAAFVTDGGGVLSHAAIVARELKKPCIIGTKTATKILKDGDLVEVDATKGIVKKL